MEALPASVPFTTICFKRVSQKWSFSVRSGAVGCTVMLFGSNKIIADFSINAVRRLNLRCEQTLTIELPAAQLLAFASPVDPVVVDQVVVDQA